MKLNIIAPAPKVSNQPQQAIPELTGYESPFGWWRVTTEGDCEGRSTTQLGTFYGHVVEIGLSLADKSYYALTFYPVLNIKPGKVMTYQATGRNVFIGLGIDSKTWNMSGEVRATWFQKWYDTDEVVVLPSSKHATYYAASYVCLK